MATQKLTKNQLRRAKKKEQKKAKAEDGSKRESETPVDKEEALVDGAAEIKEKPAAETDVKKDDDEYAVADELGPDAADDPSLAYFKDIFQKFGATETGEDEAEREANAGNKGEVFYDEDEVPSEDEEAVPKLSKKKRKQLTKLSIAELKALVANPEVVEWQDVSSSDPRLLVQIKAQRNVVPVPTHWSLKREYLSSKRGIEKPPFRLPQFIHETGITEMRDAVLEKQNAQSLKEKQRERVAPKMGRLDIDYQRLYDAFFRFQTKPELTRFGEVYYEGKEAEVDFKHFRTGDLSDEAKEALGMPPGAPPPWLINQQRFGPPPSYPTLKIPGLNAPPPPGGSWGFHPGGWGKPPVDEFNRPLFGGDVFGLAAPGPGGQPGAQPAQAQAQPQYAAEEPIDRTLWGELQPREESEEEESEEEEESDEEEEVPGGGIETPSGLETPSGMVSSVPTDYPATGVETSAAGEMDLRKTRRGIDTEEPTHPRSAYTVIPEAQGRGAEGFFGSERTYDLRGQMPVLGQEDDTRKRKKPGDVDVSINLDEIQQRDGVSRDEVKRRYEEGRREEGPGAQWSYDEDLQDMIAQESRKRQRVDKEKQEKKRENKYKF